MSNNLNANFTTLADLQEEGLTALQAAGYPFESLEADDRFHRPAAREHSHLWYIANIGVGPSGLPYLQISAGNPKISGGVDTANFVWKSWEDSSRKNGRNDDTSEIYSIRRAIEAKAVAAKAAREREHEEASIKARWEFANAMQDASKHSYLIAKHVMPHGIRAARDMLLIPVCNTNKDIRGLQRIAQDGTKRFSKDTEVTGNFHLIGDPSENKTIYVAEGYATAATIHEATGMAVAVAFDCNNLLPVASALNEAYPDCRLIIAADNDAWKDNNIGLARAKEAAQSIGSIVVFPSFAGFDTTNKPTDFNDLLLLGGIEAVRAQLTENTTLPDNYPAPTPITKEEEDVARLHPKCIVDNFLYADVATRSAPGGVGKTTLILYEAIHIALGRLIYGLTIVNRGWTCIVSAEDRREQLVARLRELMRSMDLTGDEAAIVRSNIRIWDVCGKDIKLTKAKDGNIVLEPLADNIVAALKSDPPVMVIFDPLASFNTNEEAFNTSAQAIITAARRIVAGLECCVQIVHHTGKAPAASGALDQYASRGGSALSDGSRMVFTLAEWNPNDAKNGRTAPDGCSSAAGASIVILARAKLSFARQQPLIWIRREGFEFEYFLEQPPQSRAEAADSRADQLVRFLESELRAGRYHTRNTLDPKSEDIGMTRVDLRGALATLEAAGRIVDETLPPERIHGRRKTFLCPTHLVSLAVGGHLDRTGHD